MEIISLRTRSYKSWKLNDKRVSKKAQARYHKIRQFIQLRSEGCCEETALEVIGVARSTLYRWKRNYDRLGEPGLEPGSRKPHTIRKSKWGTELRAKVLKYRRRYPTWGRKKITTLLRRDHGIKVSESTVGRILTALVLRNKIKPVRFYQGKTTKPKPRNFPGHAKRWQKHMKAQRPGQMLQMDHMTVNDHGLCIKHFEATCPVTKWTVAKAYTGASSKTAAVFLKEVIKELPFPIESIQVDGGSEFMKHFEEACEGLNIKLYVLPPRSPELNGCVERRNGTLRYEFYAIYDGLLELSSIREALAGYLSMYNTYRPHQALNMLTPMAYYQQYWQEASLSHI